MKNPRFASVWLATLAACGHPRVSPASAPVQPSTAATQSTLGLGGRLFDDWARELNVAFIPDDPRTPQADGRGGPFGNGTLPDHLGNPMPNTGHDYRLKELLGWDLRGGEGLFGASYLHVSHVLLPDLLRDTDTRERWIDRITHGEDAIPAYGSVLNRVQIEALVDFLLAVRGGALPSPDDVFTLATDTPGHYRLVAGGDAARGQAYFQQTCARCHGDDGTAFLLDDGEHSLGTLMRTEGYATWLKILNGQPGTSMQAQVPAHASREQLVQILRDLNAATCDRQRYPKGTAKTTDVPDGDARCGEYLK